MATLPSTPLLTEEQYLEIERAAEFKSEFYNGQMFGMSGGSARHAVLTSSINATLFRAIRAGCRVFSSDLRIKVSAAGLYTYPDCSVICGPPQYVDPHHDLVTNPLLLVEVLSPSSENYDRGKKFEMYRTIESLREYLILHQDRPHAEHYSKQEDGSWVLREYTESSTIPLARLEASISLDELYTPLVGLD
jgi:Uma2 family endonuclease